MNPKSLANLKGKKGSGFLSTTSTVKFRNTIQNFLFAELQYQTTNRLIKKEDAHFNALTPTAPQSPRSKAKQGAVCVSATEIRNEENEEIQLFEYEIIDGLKQLNLFPKSDMQRISDKLEKVICNCGKTKGDDCWKCIHKAVQSIFIEDSKNQKITKVTNEFFSSSSSELPLFDNLAFVTLTAKHDSTKIEAERQLFKAFRYFLKTATTDLNISYFWKTEKSMPESQHFHLIIKNYDEQIISLWTAACAKFQIYATSQSVFSNPIIAEFESILKLSHYMAKQTLFPIDARIVGMSNIFQNFQPIICKDSNDLKKLIQSAIFKKADDSGNMNWWLYEKDSKAIFNKIHHALFNV